MLEVFDEMGTMTLAFEYYLSGEPDSLRRRDIHKIRTAVQHRLLCLPTASEIGIIPESEGGQYVYECCRLAGLIYGVAVVYPMPNSLLVLQDLVQRLKTAIETLDIQRLGCGMNGVLLWILVLGGVAALDTPQRSWYASKVAFVSTSMAIEIWGNAVDIMETFLWVDSACGQGGRMLWHEAMEARSILG